MKTLRVYTDAHHDKRDYRGALGGGIVIETEASPEPEPDPEFTGTWSCSQIKAPWVSAGIVMYPKLYMGDRFADWGWNVVCCKYIVPYGAPRAGAWIETRKITNGDITMTEYTVLLTWDDEARVWVAVNDEIPLALESGSLDVLMERVRYVASEVLEANGKPHTNISLHFKAERVAVVV
jgi:hypothetical protein